MKPDSVIARYLPRSADPKLYFRDLLDCFSLDSNWYVSVCVRTHMYAHFDSHKQNLRPTYLSVAQAV